MPDGVPIAGPLMDKAAMAASAGIGSLVSGDPYDKVRAEMQAMKDRGNAAHPYARLGGNVAGSLAVLGPVGGTQVGGAALGMRGASLGGRVLNSAASGGAISAADTLARGGDATDALKSGAMGFGLGGAIPALGAAVKGGVGYLGERLGNLVRGASNPAAEAARRTGLALGQDAASGQVMNSLDDATARAANIPLMNVDRGGETTRALARSVSNQSPEVRATIEKAASDRFGGQSGRAASFINRVMGGNVDDLAAQDAIKNTARLTNKPAYDAAFAHPRAQAMWNGELQQLMQAPALQEAVMGATKRGANRAAVEGFKAIKNPFHQAADGSFKLMQKADGSIAYPSLQFWDQTKRNLDGMIGTAQRAGDNTLAGDLTAIKKKLVETLDTAVPAYKNARQGAAGFFGAEDALEAGKTFFSHPRAVPEARRAFSKFNPSEQKLFATGYASSLIDRIKDSPDRMNIINSMFKNQAKRESIELAMGPRATRMVEAYVRVEDLADRVRGAMGNSTTARQLVELGIGGAGGFALTGDWKGAIAGAALTQGPRYVNNNIERNVMKEIGKLLTADDPAAIQKLVSNAAVSSNYMKALEKMGGLLAAPSRVGAIQSTRGGNIQ
jgi:hypothetical protein